MTIQETAATSKKSLNDLFHVVRGFPLRGEWDADGVPVVRGRDVGHSAIHKADLRRLRTTAGIPNERLTKVGDILVPSLTNALKAHLVTSDLDGCIVASSVVILRPKHSGIDVQSVCRYLCSSDAAEAIANIASNLGGHFLITPDVLFDALLFRNDVQRAITDLPHAIAGKSPHHPRRQDQRRHAG